MGSLAILFTGQGNQYTQMGLDWINYDTSLKHFVDKTSIIYGIDFLKILDDTEGKINTTYYAQPAIVTTSLMAYQTLINETHIVPSAVAGFSLGEYSALIAAKVISFETAINLIFERSMAMQRCSEKQEGTMSAILGLENAVIEQLCQSISGSMGLVSPANYNCPNQLVVSGQKIAVDALNNAAKAAGAKRCLTLNVSGAFHSSMMNDAAQHMDKIFKSSIFHKPTVSVYSNVTGKPYESEDIRQLLVKQIISPVRFEDTIRHMINHGITHFLEIGAGNVLSGFVRKIDPQIPVINLDKTYQLSGVKGWLNENGFIK
jgi:[acyl-carrier-protein] S-malonyltransferase